MDRSERQELKQLSETVGQWAATARRVTSERDNVRSSGNRADAEVSRRVTGIEVGSVRYAVLALSMGDAGLLNDLRRRHDLPPVNPEFLDRLENLPDEVDTARHKLTSITGLRRVIASSSARSHAMDAEAWLKAVAEWGQSIDLPAAMKAAAPFSLMQPQLAKALDEVYGLRPHLQRGGPAMAVMTGAAITGLLAGATAVNRAVQMDAQLRHDVVRAGDDVRRSETARLIAKMPLERLKEVTSDRLRLGPIEQVGWTTVGHVLANERSIGTLPGIGEVTAARIAGAAHALHQTTYDEMPVRIDVKRRGPETTELLQALRSYDSYRVAMRHLDNDRRLALELGPVVESVSRGATHVAVAAETDDALRHLYETMNWLSSRSVAYSGSDTWSGDPWDDFLERAAVYFTLLAELGLTKQDQEKVHGDLPQEIVNAVRGLSLNTDHLKVSLRGYQVFAAKFALVQMRVLIGDEMGLGKTVEALAVLTHLRSRGRTHFLVVCPASVVTNWVREVSSKTDLSAHRLHGNDREQSSRNWRRRGGVAVTTYESLGWYVNQSEYQTVECVILDEAHAIKNPSAKRSQRSAWLLATSPFAVLMTGTPLENRVEEFRQLVGHIRPDLAHNSPEVAKAFRRHVAPAYLRRNLEDVLTELPERIEVEEWLPLSAADVATYRAAVMEGNFMAMRQAAMVSGRESQKMWRLLEIVHEAEANQRKVIVFSYFLDILSRVAAHLPGRVIGPLTGSVPAHVRQMMVDDFTQARGPAVLVSQIQAGGVGLNIQAASVVIICEPQLKPSLEEQAIARAHRMGQVQSVQVHRLLSEEGVDTRIVELLAEKRRLFDEFARRSETAASAPEAYDLSDGELARRILAEERQRFGY